MKRLLSLLLLVLGAHAMLFSQMSSRKGDFYFYWGYNRAFFSKSNISLKGPDYALTLYNVKATDRPTPFGKVYFRPQTISIPQYVYRLGYFLHDRWHLSFGLDHLKYVVTENQKVAVSGVIDTKASSKYAGQYLFDTLALTDDFVRFEHTDGFNVASLDLEYLLPLFGFAHHKHRVGLNVGLGGVWVVTRTDSRVFGEGINNNFHVSGFSMQAKTGLRYEFGRRFFALFDVRGGMAGLPWIQLRNWAPYSAEQNLFFWEYYGALGCKFRLKRREK